MNTAYHYRCDGKQIGPLTLDQMKEAAAAGALLPTDLIWATGLPGWVPASRLHLAFPPAGTSDPAGSGRKRLLYLALGAGAALALTVILVVALSGSSGPTAPAVAESLTPNAALVTAGPQGQPVSPATSPAVENKSGASATPSTGGKVPPKQQAGPEQDAKRAQAEAEFEKGNAAANARQWDQAVTHYTAALKLQPDLVQALVNRGRCHLVRGRLDDTIADCTRAIELAPQHAEAYVWLSGAKMDRGDRAGAIADATRAIERDKNQPGAWFIRGTARALQGELLRGVEDLTEAIRLDGSNATYFNNRGFAYEKLGQLQKAQADYARRDQLNGGPPAGAGGEGQMSVAKQQAKQRLLQAEAEYKMAKAIYEAEYAAYDAQRRIKTPPGVPRPQPRPPSQETIRRQELARIAYEQARQAYEQTP